MSSDLYARAKPIFQTALEMASGDRPEYLDRVCAGDTALRREVEQLLAASAEAASFLEVPIVKMCVSCSSTFSETTQFCPHCGQVLKDDPRALVGTKLDNLYLIEELLGEGGMGAVYRARHILLGDTVAIKTLKREHTQNPTVIKRFQREGRAARSFRHPNAVIVHDLRATSGGILYMVLEYIDGRNLRDEMRIHGRYSPDETIALLTPIASVLDAAHRQGVVHRDMKPENVMISKSDSGETIVKVLDLGIAKILTPVDQESSMALTSVGQILGTPQYMSPEQWGRPSRDGNPEIDGRTDVYSLAIIAYEVISGASPFSGRTVAEFQYAHTSTTPRPLGESIGSIPHEFGRAIARALEKDRVDRHPTAGAFVEELRSALEARPSATTVVQGATVPVSPNLTAAETAADSAAPSSTSPGPRDSIDGPNQSTFVEASDPVPTEAATSVPSTSSAFSRSAPPTGLPIRPMLLAAAALVLVAIAGLVAAWYVLPFPSPANGIVEQPPAAVPAVPVAPPTIAIATYSIELQNAGGTRVANGERLGKVDGFRFHIWAAVPATMAILGPDDQNVPSIFLPAGPASRLEANTSYPFPKGVWVHSDFSMPSDTFTVLLFPEGTEIPAVLRSEYGHRLSPAEQRRIGELRSRSPIVATPSNTETTLNVEATRANAPVVFDIVLDYSTPSNEATR